MSDEFVDSDGHYYPLVMEDGTVCMQLAFETSDTILLHQQYDGRRATVTRKLYIKGDMSDEVSPDQIAYSDVTVGRGLAESNRSLNQVARPFVEYTYSHSADVVGVGVTIYNPLPGGKRDEMLCSAYIRPGVPTQLILTPFPRGESFDSPAYETLDEAVTDMKPTLQRVLSTPGVFHSMEHISGIEHYTDNNDPLASEAKEYVRNEVHELCTALFPDDVRMQQQTYMLAKGLSVIDAEADSLLRQARYYGTKDIAALQTLPRDDQLTLLAERVMRRINALDASLPQPVVFCDLNETGVAYTLRSSADLPNDEDDEAAEQPFMIELLPKAFGSYRSMIHPDDTNFAYRFDPLPNGTLITLFTQDETGYQPQYRLLLGTCDPAAVAAIGNNPRANFSLIPQELAKVSYENMANGQKVSSADLASDDV